MFSQAILASGVLSGIKDTNLGIWLRALRTELICMECLSPRLRLGGRSPALRTSRRRCIRDTFVNGDTFAERRSCALDRSVVALNDREGGRRGKCRDSEEKLK